MSDLAVVTEKCVKKRAECINEWQGILQQNYKKMLENNEDDDAVLSPVSLKRQLRKLSWSGRNLGIITSGGDSQGMNAALRAIVRMGLYLESKVFYIKEGYQGMIDSLDNFEEATLQSTANIINMGGTLIGSARCKEFKERSGRLKAAKNLVTKGINNLVVIGGDGSLTGANTFRHEWPSLIRELVDKDMVSHQLAHQLKHLNIVGIVGSIDNDFCGTDMTIGADSALHRILGSIDDITTTAVSHKRAFVLEIMGRNCGYLPLVAGLASEASAIFIPENPPPGDWRQYLCDELREKCKRGEVRRTHIVLVAEGAVDRHQNPIRSNDVQKVLSERMNMDTRVTVLGHVQRGGITSAFDRTLGSRQGVDAVLALTDSTPKTPAYVIGVKFGSIVRFAMMKNVEKTQLCSQYLGSGDFDLAVKLRGRSLYYNMYVQGLLNQVSTHPKLLGLSRKKPLRIAMVHVGKPACGMNAVARAFVIIALSKGYVPVFVYNSWKGLIKGTIQEMNRNDVHLWTGKGESMLGTDEATLEDAGPVCVARGLAKHDISGLMIVGGFEGFRSACQIHELRKTYKEYCIPTIMVPVTICNNIPGFDHSIGCDTAVNQICKACDALRSSAISLNKCVYVVEVGGDNCGYLATMGGLATGADRAFIREESFTVADLRETCHMLKERLDNPGVTFGLILRSENANPNLTTEFIYRMLKEEGKPLFNARISVLGDTQVGDTPSPYDRSSGLKVGARSTLWMIDCMEQYGANDGKVFADNNNSLAVPSMQQGKLGFNLISDLISQTDFKHSVPKHNWWLELRPLFQIFSWHNKAVV